jgi:hypothetical protein
MERVLAPDMQKLLLAIALLVGCASAEQPRDSGSVAVQLTSVTAIHRGENTLVVTIDHDDATRVEAMLWMPSMGHGAASDPRVVRETATTYRLENVMFTMSGTWEIRLAITCGHGQTTRTFRYDVP